MECGKSNKDSIGQTSSAVPSVLKSDETGSSNSMDMDEYDSTISDTEYDPYKVHIFLFIYTIY